MFPFPFPAILDHTAFLLNCIHIFQLTIYIPQPTWGNHIKVFTLSGLTVRTYRYYDPATRGLDLKGIGFNFSCCKLKVDSMCFNYAICSVLHVQFHKCVMSSTFWYKAYYTMHAHPRVVCIWLNCCRWCLICSIDPFFPSSYRIVRRPQFCSYRCNCTASCLCSQSYWSRSYSWSVGTD
jgi:hypothetical protein